MLTIAKQQTCQKYILKINSRRLRKSKWNLTLSLKDARKNSEMISLMDSQTLRWIDEINKIKDADNLNEAADIIENAILYMDMVNSSISSVMDDYEDKMLKVLEKY